MKCQLLDLGVRMLFKQHMHGLKKGSGHDVLPEILSGGFQFPMRNIVIRLLASELKLHSSNSIPLLT